MRACSITEQSRVDDTRLSSARPVSSLLATISRRRVRRWALSREERGMDFFCPHVQQVFRMPKCVPHVLPPFVFSQFLNLNIACGCLSIDILTSQGCSSKLLFFSSSPWPKFTRVVVGGGKQYEEKCVRRKGSLTVAFSSFGGRGAVCFCRLFSWLERGHRER